MDTRVFLLARAFGKNLIASEVRLGKKQHKRAEPIIHHIRKLTPRYYGVR